MARLLGSYDWLHLGEPQRTAPFRAMLIGPRMEGIQEATEFLKDRFGKLVETIFAKGHVTEHDLVAFLQLDPRVARLLGRDIEAIEECARDIEDLLDQSQEDTEALSSEHLNRFADKLAKYNVIRMVGHFLEEWENVENRPYLSRSALVQLMSFLQEDFSSESGIVKELYENVRPRLDKLLRSL